MVGNLIARMRSASGHMVKARDRQVMREAVARIATLEAENAELNDLLDEVEAWFNQHAWKLDGTTYSTMANVLAKRKERDDG